MGASGRSESGRASVGETRPGSGRRRSRLDSAAEPSSGFESSVARWTSNGAGDQLTQASGQWTVTIPYSSLTYNLPQGSGFQDPTFAEEKDERSIVSEHYISLKRYLSVTWGDGNPNPPLSKHGYELQRLTSSQFLELSTDVGDELKRREFASRRPSNVPPGAGPPDYLLPEENFHPKRNEARQKMSSLRAPRFRDLATAVFCELERRFPRFAAGDIHRVKSAMSNP